MTASLQLHEKNSDRTIIFGREEANNKDTTSLFQLQDNRPEASLKKKVHQLASTSPIYSKVISLKENINKNNLPANRVEETQELSSDWAVQRVKYFMRYNDMTYSGDFSDRHLANNLDDAFNLSVTRCYNDNLDQSTVIVANAALRRNLLRDFADDYNDDNHDEHDNIVASRQVTIVHTEFVETFDDNGVDVHVYDSQRWDNVVINAGVGLNQQYFGQIGHLDSTEGGNAQGSVYRTSFLENGETDWFNEQ